MEIKDNYMIDKYMYDLSKEIKNNEDLKNFKTNYSYLKTTKTYLRSELDLFYYLNIKLRDVYAKYRGKITYTNPKNINIILDKEIQIVQNEQLKVLKGSHLYKDKMFIIDGYPYDIYFRYIFLNNYYNYCIESAYIHEIVHTQAIEGVNVENIRNKELLPIFFEILEGHKFNKNIIWYKLLNYAQSIDIYMNTTSFEDRLLSSCYIESTLKAIDLYDLYINSSNQVKKELLKDIQNVFDSNISLEDLLKKYGITYDSFKPSLQRLLSYEK